MLREAWKARPHPELAEIALATSDDPAARLKAAARLVEGSPGHVENDMLLARAYLDARMLPEARRHAEAAERKGMNEKRLWLLVADLEGAEHGDTEAGRIAQRDALRHATTAEPDPVWRCDACGAEQTRWQPACPVCHAPGRIRWGGPTRAAPTRMALPAP